MEITKVGYFTSNQIVTAIEHLRIIAPLKYAGFHAVPCFIEGKIDFNVARDCQIFVIHRDFAGDFSSYRELIVFAKQVNIPVILDLDDNLLELPDDHPDTEKLYYANQLLPLVQSMGEVNAITVSTPELKEAFERYNLNIHVLPNFLDSDIWSFKPPVSLPNVPIRVLYMGSATHRPDLEMVRPAIEVIADRHPEVQFLFLGVEAPESLVTRKQAVHIPSVTFEYKKFAKMLGTVDADLAIAPLLNNVFNACKSPLKFFEYSAIGLPGVYSDIGPYSRIVEDNRTGLLASDRTEEWVEKLEYLITNTEARHSIAQAAQDLVKQKYTLQKNAHLWRETYQATQKTQIEHSRVISIPFTVLTNINQQHDKLTMQNYQTINFLNEQIQLHKEQEEKYVSDIQEVKLTAESLLVERNKTVNLLNEEIQLHKQQEEKYVSDIQEVKLAADNLLVERNKSLEELRSVYNSRSWKVTKILRESKSRLTPNEISFTKRSTDAKDDINLIRTSGYFNEDWYLKHYPDVKNSRLDPVKHYYLYGGTEGRNPSDKFDSAFYLNQYPDVKEAGLNPLVHYLKHGKSEGKLSLPFPKQDDIETPHEQSSTSPSPQGFYLKKAIHVLKEDGIGALIRKGQKKLFESKAVENEIIQSESTIDYVISIVIPAFNAISFTKACIEKLYQVGSKHQFEVIVVDNASSDETQAEMQKENKSRPDFSYYRLGENLGFAGGVNFGIQKAKGRYVVILNNDTLPTSGWLDDMVQAFEGDPTIGIISPVTNYVGEGPQLEIAAKDIEPVDIDAYAAGLKGRGIYCEPGRLVFFCVMIRRSVIDQIGLLDEGYVKGNFEDDDYCLRAILSGYKLAIAKSAFVFHHGSITFKKNKIVHNEYMELNRKRFFLKTGNLAVSLRAPFERTQNPRFSVVVRTLNRKHLLQKALASLANQNFRDFEVVLVNDGGESVQDIVDKFSQYFPINYVQHENSKGRTPALNAGIANVSTEWVTFLDDDDIVYPWHLATLFKYTQLNPAGKMFYGNYNRTLFQTTHADSPALLKGVEPWPYKKDELWVSNRIPMHTWLLDRKCFDKVGLFDENQVMLEDFEFLVRLSTKLDFVHVDRVTCEYRFYLDGMNSMINHRGKTLASLEYIYSKHQAYNQNIAENRRLELMALGKQIIRIEELKQQLSDDAENNDRVMRIITQLILGF